MIPPEQSQSWGFGLPICLNIDPAIRKATDFRALFTCRNPRALIASKAPEPILIWCTDSLRL